MQSAYNINDLRHEAQYRWLKPAEVLYILQNHEEYQLSNQPPHLPTSGSLYLFNKRVLKFFRRDGHNWRKKRDQRTVGEAHERLKVGNVETLNCYYAHGEQNPHFQRRSYWMLDPAYDHIVLVHYRDVTKGKPTSAVSHSPNSSPQYLASISIGSDANESSQSLSSPQSTEVSSETVIKASGIEHLDGVSIVNSSNPSNLECAEALNKLKQQLSLNDDTLEELDPFFIEYEHSNSSGFLDDRENGNMQSQHEDLVKSPGFSISYDFAGEQHNFGQDELSNYILLQHSDVNDQFLQASGCGYTLQDKESSSWKEMLESCSQETLTCRLNDNEKSLSSGKKGLEGGQTYDWARMAGGSDSSYLLHEDKFENPRYPSIEQSTNLESSYYTASLNNQQAFFMGPSLTVAAQQKYTIKDICPAWGYTTEYTKVIIVGSFLCDPSESTWACMFGETEVPVEIIQGGVIRCEAPPHSPGKVTICITSGNRESCSEVREFEYQMKSNVCTHCNLTLPEASRSTDELLLLVRFVQQLLSDSSMHQADGFNTEIHLVPKVKADDDTWSQIIEALLVGSGTSLETMNWLLEELLKDKLDKWLSHRSRQNLEVASCPLSKKEQGIIHMIAGLGYEWALNPILSSGVGIDFRDINGWTALHWAARFGREKMVASLIASGASPGAVTDPSAKDPTGKTPASIAATHGFKGLAGYLSEVSLTSHLSALTLEESEFSKESAEVEAERTLSSISKESLATSEDHLSLKDTLAAVRNAAQAAARIQSAFRAHSFKKRLQKEASTDVDEYGISRDDIQGLQALSKLSRNSRDYNSAALSIQKKYRGWKGRKDFLALRQKVVKIQAHVRGYQVRKNYKVICWAVGILDKAILRWRRKGVGLRKFRQEADSIDDSEDEDILKVFRKQKVDAAIDEAVSRVLFMVESPEARQQYRRVLEKYRQVKAELGSTSMEAAPATSIDFGDLNVEDYMFDLP